jgi:hypothetical protein
MGLWTTNGSLTAGAAARGSGHGAIRPSTDGNQKHSQVLVGEIDSKNR